MATDGKAPGMKSAYELALERLEAQGIERPDTEALSDEARAQMAEIRSKADAELAQLEIMHRERRSATDPLGLGQLEEDYRLERRRIEEHRDARLERLRRGV